MKLKGVLLGSNRVFCKRHLSGPLLALITLAVAAPGYAAVQPAVDLTTVTGAVGTTVTLPVTLTNATGTSISAIGLEVDYDPAKLGTPNATIGAGGSAAGKTVYTYNPTPGVFRLGVFGPNNSAIGDGVVVNVTFNMPYGTAPGPTTLSNTATASDPTGNPVLVTGAVGTVTLPTATLSSSIVGSGTITNTNTNGATFSCNVSSCNGSFAAGTPFVFTPTASGSFLFSAWSGTGSAGSCSGNGTCSFVLSANSTVNATFITMPPIKVLGPPDSYFQTVTLGYQSALPQSSITMDAQDTTFSEVLNLASPVNLTLMGGYDSNFSTQPGRTTLQGSITISKGTLVVDHLAIK